MALVSAPCPMPYGWLCEYTQGSFAFTTDATLDAAGEYMAWVGYAQQDMVVSHVGFLPGAVSGSPTVETRIETVDPATGFPTGTLFGTNTNGTSGTVATNTWVLQALTASATINKGQAFAVLQKYASGTSVIVRNVGNLIATNTSLPYQVTNTTGSAVKASLAYCKALVLGSSATAFYHNFGMLPVSALANNTFNNTSSARRGLRFQVPYPTRIIGARWYNNTAVGDFNFTVYSDAGTELGSSSTAFEGDISGIASSGIRRIFLDNPVELAKATWYRATFEPTSATNINLSTFQLPSADYRSAMPTGLNSHYTTYVASSWTDSATDTLPVMDILLDQFDDGTSGGGGTVTGVIGS